MLVDWSAGKAWTLVRAVHLDQPFPNTLLYRFVADAAGRVERDKVSQQLARLAAVCGLREAILNVFQTADVLGSDGRRPRVHDLRHVFALQALLRWYREGLDVQSQLPKLALYMGHVSIVSTAYYLKWIPALAEVASQRFEAHCGHVIDGGE